MTYPRQTYHLGIEDLTSKLESLPEGKILRIEDGAEAIKKIRYALYAWMHEFGIKSLYKIVWTNPECLQVIRKVIPKPRSFVEGIAPEIKDYIISISDIFDEAEALALIKDNLDQTQWSAAIDEWRRICAT